MYPTTPYQEGRTAYINGFQEFQNPYDVTFDDYEHTEWRLGFEDAEYQDSLVMNDPYEEEMF
jgi:hypothetical protein